MCIRDRVKVLEIDDKGRLNLSRRDALIEVEGLVPENTISDSPRRPEPVSYTHLDVYKRQDVLRCAQGWQAVV